MRECFLYLAPADTGVSVTVLSGYLALIGADRRRTEVGRNRPGASQP